MKSRRDFLKIAGLSAFALGTASALTLATGSKASALPAGTAPAKGSYTNEPDALHAKRWAMVIDTRKFTSPEHFQRVIDACHHAHNVPTIPGNQDVKWIWTDKYAHVFPDDVNAYMPEKFLHGDFLLLCNHCENPPCVRVCPTAATFKREDGIVVMDPHRCIGCRFCMAGCPYGARSFNFMDPRKHLPKEMPNPTFPTRMIGVVEKCTFCAERLAVGQMPACVAAANGRIIFGDLDDPNSDVRHALAENYSIRRKPNLGTQPGVYYLI